jgi:hypothetical protein
MDLRNGSLQRSGRIIASHGDFIASNCQKMLPEKENDYDVIRYFPTGYHATELAGVKPGDLW